MTMIFQSTFKGHTDYIQCLGLREKKNQFLSGSEDGTVRVWGKNSQTIRNLKLTLSRLGDWNLPALILNADISITVTAMTLTFHDFSKKYIVSMGRKNGEKILCKKNVTEYS